MFRLLNTKLQPVRAQLDRLRNFNNHKSFERKISFVQRKTGTGLSSVASVSSAAVAAGCLLHYHQYQVKGPVLCEHVAATVTAVETQKQVEKARLLDTLRKDIAEMMANTWKMLRYMQRIFTYFLYGAPLAALLPVAYFLGPQFPPIEEMTWDYMIWAITELGPCFIKLAQWASTRPDLFAPALVDRLTSLQDDVQVSHSFKVVEKTMADSFGPEWKTKIALDPIPVGAGSVAQVFRGTIKALARGGAGKETFELIQQGSTITERKEERRREGGEEGVEKEVEVAIKLIHPHVERQIRVDMDLLTHVADLIDRFPDLEILSLGETCRQFAESMHKQLDLRVEANNLSKFAKNFADETWATFPIPVVGLVTKNVLVETLVKGQPIQSFMKLTDELGDGMTKEMRTVRKKLSDLGVRLILKMIFFDNFIHGDLHPGNVFVEILPNGEPQLHVIDCGIVYASKSEADHKQLVDICFAFMQHDGRHAAEMMMEKADASLGSLEKRKKHFMDDMQQLVVDCEKENIFEHIGDYVTRICTMARDNLVRLDPGYFKIAMALKVAEGMSLSFDRELDVVSKCVPIVLKARALRAMGVTKFPSPAEDEDLEAQLEDISRTTAGKK